METTVCLSECADTVANIYKWTKITKPPFNLTWTPMNPYLRREPKGVVLIIVPFNFPLFLAISPLVRRPSVIQSVVQGGCGPHRILGCEPFRHEEKQTYSLVFIYMLAWCNGRGMLHGH